MKYLLLAALLIPSTVMAADAPRQDPLIPEITEFGREVRTVSDKVSDNGREQYDMLSSRVNALESRATQAYENDSTWRDSKRAIKKDLRKLRREFRDFQSKSDNIGSGSSDERMPSQEGTYPPPSSNPRTDSSSDQQGTSSGQPGQSGTGETGESGTQQRTPEPTETPSQTTP